MLILAIKVCIDLRQEFFIIILQLLKNKVNNGERGRDTKFIIITLINLSYSYLFYQYYRAVRQRSSDPATI